MRHFAPLCVLLLGACMTSHSASTTSTAPNASVSAASPASDDPYLWLEDVEGERAMAVGEGAQRPRRSACCRATRATRRSTPRRCASSRRPTASRTPSIRGAHDRQLLAGPARTCAAPGGARRRRAIAARAPSGRRCSTSTRSRPPRAPTGSSKGTTASAPRSGCCLVALSNGGKDADEVREFDVVTKQFVDGGFRLPESKGERDVGRRGHAARLARLRARHAHRSRAIRSSSSG